MRPPPSDFIQEGLRWPDGAIDEKKAAAAGVLATVEFLREAALKVRAERRSRTQDAIALRAGVYPDTIGRLERGTAWPDVESLTRVLDAVGLTLHVTKKAEA
ncbi:MAG TPA: helix-turn-helix transcriptional regulator [Acidothermaceae bacterium]|jgi:hypothetical protein|nr:helix-turn-helix transcriptional regulator [Acidothermaceae bacterium]